MKEMCDNCRFSKDTGERSPLTAMDESIDPGEIREVVIEDKWVKLKWLKCRRQSESIAEPGGFPRVRIINWCGDYEKKEEIS